MSLFLVVADSSGWQLAETTLQRWQQMERQHRSECVRFSIEQKKHLWGILLLHVLPQRGLEGIEKGLYIVTKELPYWDLDRNWVKCVEQELICRKEAVEKETRVEESSWVQEANIPRTTGTSGIGQAEELSTDNVTERNESVWSKTWTLVQQVDSPMFRISVVASFCLLLYSLKRSFQTTRTSHPLSQGLIDILRMAFGLSYGRPGI